MKLPFYFSSYAASAARAANVARVFGGCFLKHVQQQVGRGLRWGLASQGGVSSTVDPSQG